MKLKSMATGILVGILNGLFGAGGGMVAVPLLRNNGLEDRQAHATSIAVILPLSLVSVFLYLQSGHMQLDDIFPFLPGGILGAAAGGLLLNKIPVKWLRRIFGILIIYAAIRLLRG